MSHAAPIAPPMQPNDRQIIEKSDVNISITKNTKAAIIQICQISIVYEFSCYDSNSPTNIQKNGLFKEFLSIILTNQPRKRKTENRKRKMRSLQHCYVLLEAKRQVPLTGTDAAEREQRMRAYYAEPQGGRRSQGDLGGG